MIKVYVAGKLNDPAADYIKNLHKMISAADSLRKDGYAVFCPGIDLLIGLYAGDWEYYDYFENSQPWLEASDAMFLVGGWEESEGTGRELEKANRLGIPIFADQLEMDRYFNQNPAHESEVNEGVRTPSTMLNINFTNKLKFKRLDSNAKAPQKAHQDDACFDLFAYSIEEEKQDGFGVITYGTGVAVQIPKGYVGLLFPRSSVSKKDLMLKNSVGVIDSGYRGEVKLKFHMTDIEYNAKTYSEGDKIGQLMIMPVPQFQLEEVEELEDSERGEGGFGSTGNK